MQLELECIGVEKDNTLVRIPGNNPDDMARFLVTRFDSGYERFLTYDVSAEVREQLAAFPAEQAFRDHSAVKAILAGDFPCEEVSVFAAYVFPEMFTTRVYPDVIRLPGKNDIGKPLFGVTINGEVASACGSVRENGRCGEAYVWTEERYRRRGYARQATAAWAHDLQRQGKIPFYSHNKIENTASRAVARSLELAQFMSAVGYD